MISTHNYYRAPYSYNCTSITLDCSTSKLLSETL